MKDEYVRFLIRLARSYQRPDWLEFTNALTRYELSVFEALETVEPYGEDRSDLRQAVNTARIVASLSSGEIDSGDYDKLVEGLRHYLKCNSEDLIQEMTPTQLKEVMKAAYK